MTGTSKFILAAAMLAGAICPAAAAETDVWKTVSASDNSTYAIKTDGTLWSWGSGEEGELGDGSGVKMASVPQQMGTDTDWKAAYGARGCGFFLKENGTLWTIGSNEKGMSGVGDGVTKHTTLTQVGTDSDWECVYTSVTWCYTVLAKKADGTLWAWGSGETFALGNGKADNVAVPIQVGTDNDWKEASIGNDHVLALKNDGSLWGWGFASYNQLLNTDENIVRTPTRLGTDTWASVKAIDNASYGIKADGTLWAWGDNQRNLLGLDIDMTEVDSEETLPNVSVPTQVTAITARVSQISGCEKARVVLAEGKIYTWGDNSNGALGNGKGEALEAGTGQFEYKPTVITLPDGVVPVAISCGQRFTTLIDTEGALYGWGSNRWGQLGNYVDASGMTFEPSPVQLGVPAPAKPGDYTVDAEDIPTSLADAVNLKLTGEWDNAKLQKLCNSIGAVIGWPPVGNNTLETVDMTEATFAPNTSFSIPGAMQDQGLFKMCKALKSVTFPTNETAANIVSLDGAFWNCESLTVCDVSRLVNVTNINNAFYSTKVANFDLSAWNNVTKSEDAFGHDYDLTSVILPANFTVGKYLFNSCSSLRLIDWSAYEGETAPVVASDANVFEMLNSEQQGKITMIVPAAAFESFKASATWQKVNLVAATAPEEGTYTFDPNNIPDNLSDAKKIVLTGGPWETDDFKAISNALGNNASTSGNSVLETVDMSQAEIAVGTNLCAGFPGLFGNVTKGIFTNCKALTTVIMPAADQAANFRSFEKAFSGCSALTEIDLSGCTGLNNTNEIFYNCEALAKVKLPANFKFGSETFDRCEALTTIDWTTYGETTAPAYKMGSLPTLGKSLTIIVPAAAYDAFTADSNWKAYNIVSDSQSGIGSIEAESATVSGAVYDLSGRRVATVANADELRLLPAGIYIVAGKKILVK